MSEGQQIPPAGQEGSYKAGALIVYSLPDEVAIPVRRDQFEVLCDGGIGEARANRDLCLGICGGAVAGLVGVLATTEWSTVWSPERRGSFLFWLAILFLMASGSFVGACIHGMRLWRTRKDSPYSRVKARLLELYDARSNPKTN